MECSKTYPLVIRLRIFIETEVTNEIEWNILNFIMNCAHKDPAHVVNLITLIAKQYTFIYVYIHRCQCLNTIPTFRQLKSEIYQVHSIELYIAKSKGKFVKHAKKWQSLIGYDLTEISNEIDAYINN